MTTTIRRFRRRRASPPWTALAVIALLLALAGWAVVVVWARGGPQPVHEIVIALPAPQLALIAGRRA